MNTSQQTHVLERIVRQNPADLLKTDTNDSKVLANLYVECCNVKLTTHSSCRTDQERLHALFTVAVDHGLPCVVIDYLEEVCLNESIQYSDMELAYLSDGGCVSSWCAARMDALLRLVSANIQGILDGSVPLPERSSTARGLLEVAHALSDSSTAKAQSEAKTLVQSAEKLQQIVKVLEFLQRANLPQGLFMGRHSSVQEWQLSLREQRAAQPYPMFLDSLLSALHDDHKVGSTDKLYPFASLSKAVQHLFSHDFENVLAIESRLNLLLYYLLDAGHEAVLPHFKLAFPLLQGKAELMYVFQILDELRLHRAPVRLAKAFTILQSRKIKQIPFQIIEALCGLEELQMALQLLPRAQRSPLDSVNSLKEEVFILKLLLESNRLEDAFFEFRRYCQSLALRIEASMIDKPIHAMIGLIADWADSENRLGHVVNLPFNKNEEQALVKLLDQKIARHEPSGDALVLFYLIRGRLPEAISTFRSLKPLREEHKGARINRQHLFSLVSEAEATLPDLQREDVNLSVPSSTVIADTRSYPVPA